MAREHRNWRKHQRSRRHHVTGYCIISGMELMAEHGSVLCSRLWDAHHTLAELPDKPLDANALEDRFDTTPVPHDDKASSDRARSVKALRAVRRPNRLYARQITIP